MSDAPSDSLSGLEISHLRHELRTPVNQIVGYCEMLLEDAQEANQVERQATLSEALNAVREATAMIDAALSPTATSLGRDRIQLLYEELHKPQTRIIDAMSGILRDGNGADPAFIADVCRIRDAAERLLPTDRPRAEPTRTFNAPASVLVAPTKAVGSRLGTSARILVVDDVEENRGVLERRLNREGHAVVCATSGPEAIDLAGRSAFDMILLDVMMPGMDGYETLERLKRSDDTRDVPVIMISALDDIASIVKCIERGAEDYLPKPFDPVLLRARISASLEKKALREREKAFVRDVMKVVAAAVSIERGGYSEGSLDGIASRTDEVGTLARVFDTMAAGIKAREKKLLGQIDRLREEIAGVSETVEETHGNAEALPIGHIFATRYTIDRLLGVGGMGMVFLAQDTELGEQVAIKTLRTELLTSDETAIERFRNEIRLARKMSHRNIVRTHDFGKSEEVFFVTMEFVEGTTLRVILDNRGQLGHEATLAIARQLADALDCAHGQGIIHRDIKPQNLLIDAAGTLKVMDFGVARLAERQNNLTQAGMVVGTPTYMAPEQLLDENVDVRSDLYSAGVVLYECLTGKPPFEASSPISLIAKVLHDRAKPPNALRPDIPHSVSALVMELLDKDPGARVQSAKALSDRLSAIK